MSATLHVYPDTTALALATAETMATCVSAAVTNNGRASIALSGGSTPRAVYELLAQKNLDWKCVHVFWGDERCVPSDSPESNFHMTYEALLAKALIPKSNIHRVMTEHSPENAALAYEVQLKTHFKGSIPVFDLFLLGLGEDGHTASLFPGTAGLSERKRLAVDVFVPGLSSRRVTLTFPVINASRKVMFLVSGESKATIVREVVERKPGKYPAESVLPADGPVWFLDAPAASLLSKKETA